MNTLFISYNLFCVDKSDGGRQVSFRNRECLRKAVDGEFYTFFITFGNTKKVKLDKNEYAFSGAQNKFQSLINYSRFYAMITPEIERKFIDFIITKKIDLVFFDTSIFGRTIKKVAKLTTAKTVCYMHNIEAKYAYNKVKNESKTFYPLYWSYKYNEKLAVKYADYIISISERDACELEKTYGRKTDRVVHVTFEDDIKSGILNFAEEHKEKVELLFVGSYFTPNVQGIDWFIKNVLSLVPAKLTIVGKGMEALKDKYDAETVSVVGSVTDLEPYYTKYDAVVLPIFSGSGMKVKTAEAMKYGKILFATDEALEGYEDMEGFIYRCNSKDDFINAISDYIKKGISKSSEVVRKQFKSYYSNESAEKEFKEAVGDVFNAKRN